jgi:hypothetical protein
MESMYNTLIESKYRILYEGDNMFKFEPNFIACHPFCAPVVWDPFTKKGKSC